MFIDEYKNSGPCVKIIIKILNVKAEILINFLAGKIVNLAKLKRKI